MIETEFAVICNTCEHVVAYWAYGNYDPSYYMSEAEFNKLYNGDFTSEK